MPRPRTFDDERVIDDALEVFWNQGYAGTSVQNLVDATGLNRASLYNAFGDKHGLFVRVLRRYESQWVARVIDALNEAASPKAAIRALFEQVAEEAATCKKRRGCLMTNAATELGAHDDATARRVRENFARIETTFEAAVRRGQSAGELSGGADARALARFLTSSLQGLRVMAKTGPDRAALQDVVDTTLRALD
jgi:TetR/AcrR family transcriptional repressor of nem operon